MVRKLIPFNAIGPPSSAVAAVTAAAALAMAKRPSHPSSTTNSAPSPSSSLVPLTGRMGRSQRQSRPRNSLWTEAEKNGWNKTFADGRCHLTAVNHNTEARSIVRLSLPPKPIANPYVNKLSHLPSDAVEALGAIMTTCKRAPKQLQAEADKLSNQLDVRHFPFAPHEVQRARSEVLNEIFEHNPAFIYEYNIWQNRPAIDEGLAEQVKKRLAQRRYNWKPLKFKDHEQAVIYALSRFPGHFAEMKRVLAEFDRNGFVPEKILDYGSGIGSAFWAAYERWGDNVKEYALIDKDLAIRHFSMDLLRGRNYSGSGDLVTRNLFFRKELFPSSRHTYDLVILHRTLIEMASHEERLALVDKLWSRTNKYLLIVDSPMADSFKALMKIRDHVVTGGYDFDLEQTKALLWHHLGRLDQDTIEMFADPKVETYEKYCRARELLPEEVEIPTRLEAGHVFAPCPHDQHCPSLTKREPCTFSVKWQEFRADHKTRSPRRDGTEKGKFCYLILAKGERPKAVEEEQPRILELNLLRRCVECRVCTASNELQNFVASKRMGKVYARIRRAMPSQLLPVKFDLLKTESGQRQPRRIETNALHEEDDQNQEEEIEEEELKQIASGQD